MGAMIDRGTSSIRARDKTPEKTPSISVDNIDSLLDDENSPEKETLQAVTTKKGRISLKKVEESVPSADFQDEEIEEAGAVRRGGRVRKTLDCTDVYKSAKEELANKRESAVMDKEDEAAEKTDWPTRKT